jgi:hypothetical protein
MQDDAAVLKAKEALEAGRVADEKKKLLME